MVPFSVARSLGSSDTAIFTTPSCNRCLNARNVASPPFSKIVDGATSQPTMVWSSSTTLNAPKLESTRGWSEDSVARK